VDEVVAEDVDVDFVTEFAGEAEERRGEVVVEGTVGVLVGVVK
jgi:hypothetical protein